MLQIKEFKRFMAILAASLLLCLILPACSNKGTDTSSSSASETTLQEETSIPEETTTQTEETSESRRRVVVEVEELNLVMTALGRGVIRDEPSFEGLTVGVFDADDEFHVIGRTDSFYVVELPDGEVGYITISKLEEQEEIPQNEESQTEESEETTVTSEEQSSETTAPASTAASEATAAQTQPAEPSQTPPPPQETPAPAAPTGPDLNVSYNGNSIGAYEVEGVGTVYGYFTDTSYFNALVNDHRSQMGLAPWNYTYSDATRLRAIECSVLFDHTRPNGSSCLSLFGGCGGEIIYSGTDNESAFNAFMSSDGHRGIIEDNPYYFPNASSAAFIRVDWDGYSWQFAGSGFVNNCW